MADKQNIAEQYKLLEERVRYLEEVNRSTVDALEMAASLGDFQTSINKFENSKVILHEAGLRLKQLISFQTISFFLTDENSSTFNLTFCEPEGHADVIVAEKEQLIEKNLFSWALNRQKPVFVSSDTHTKQLLIHTLATSSRIRGIFLGVLAEDVQEIPDSTLRLISIIMLNIANAIESYELYKWIKNINVNLEGKVAELAKSEAELQKINLSLNDEINERKRVEKALLRARDDWEATFDAITDIVMLLDNEQRIVQINKAGTESLKLPKERLLGKRCYEVIHGLDKPPGNCPMLAGKDLLKPMTAEIVETRIGGTFLCSVAPLFDSEGQQTGSIHSLKDVSEFKSLEARFQQAQKMEAIGTLAGGIAHDFNNLLMGIQGNISMILADDSLAKADHEKLKSIEKLAKSGAKLTAHLLGYARKGKYEVRPINLNLLVTDTVNTFCRTRKEITTKLDLAPDLYPVDVDSGQIEQVILNLLINASDAMPGGGCLTVQTMNTTSDAMNSEYYSPEPGDYVLLRVTDNGVGMDQDTIERIFDPFFTTKEMGQGTGLGLASAYGIIKGHNGYIDVKSEKGVATSFMLFLPPSTGNVQQVFKASTELVKGSEAVLLVDDEAFILKVGKDMLEKLGYRVYTAGNGAEALEIYRKNQADISLVILDMVMPDLGGGQVYDGLKEISTKIKVLLSSGYSIDGQATNILKRGCEGFIQKPFGLVELSHKIREVLDRG